MSILVNSVFQYIESNEGEISKIRIIWINSENTFAFYLPLEVGESFPQSIRISELEKSLILNELREILDPYIGFINEDNIPNSHKEIRDRNWLVVEYLWNYPEPEILFKQHRKTSIKKAAEKFNISERSVRRIMFRFWQRGMTKNALLPDYTNCGTGTRKVTNKKRGRPTKIGLGGETITGINVTPEIENIFRLAIEKHYKKQSKPNLTDTYQWMLRQWFSDKFKIGKDTLNKVWDRGRLVSIDQFRYWYNKQTNKKDIYISRHGQNSFDLHYRELLGNSTMETVGPLWRYQIDATLADVYLLNRTRTRIIGRPVVYIIFDVFSRLGVGLYIGLEGPSWLGAVMAVDNILEDKVELCKKYGITMKAKDWPNAKLPLVFIADRGEFEGKQADRLVNNLGIIIENTPPRRGDLKGIVERYFRTGNERVRRLAPGAVEKEFMEAKANGRDYRLDARLTLYEFTQLMINSILLHNSKVISGYPLEPDLYADEVKPIPIELWNWGIRKRFVATKKCDRDTLRLNSLPVKEVRITKEGIKFDKDLFYSCEKAIEEGWFTNRVGQTIEIVYDPRKNVRFHLIRRLRNFNQPLPIHFDIERKISVLIRRGYLARNPINKEYIQRLQVLNTIKEQKESLDDEHVIKRLNNYIRSTADCMSIIGVSGIGKTTAVEKLLLMYPQVVYHQEYKNFPLTRIQIVWLKIDSPHDGSLKTLCLLFFKAIDDVLGSSNYFKMYSSETVSKMMIHMAYLSSLYGIGLLVIDETQFFVKKKSESDQILNFLVTMTNTIGVPIIVIGTFKAMRMLEKELKSGRRLCSEAGILWDRMANTDDWNLFLESMWDYQCLKEKAPLTPELNKILYEESQGITAIALNLFILTQGRALFTKNECITPDLIRRTSKRDLFMIQPIVKAIKNNDYNLLSKYEDILIDVDSILTSMEKDYNLQGVVSNLLKEKKETEKLLVTNMQKNIVLELTMLGMFGNLTDTDFRKIAEQVIDESEKSTEYAELKQKAVRVALDLDQVKRSKLLKKENAPKSDDQDLRNIFRDAVKKKIQVYEILMKNGFIKDPIVELHNVQNLS